MLIIAHRGASALAPENTLSAFREAVRAGADLIELDIRLSHDREVVVFHDRDLDRTTDGTGPVGEMTLADLQQLDAGFRFSSEFSGERIPTLVETLEFAAAAGVGLYLEMKIDRGEEESRSELVARTLGILQAASFPHRLLLASFDLPAVHQVRATRPETETGLIFREEAVWERLAAGGLSGIDILSARWDILTTARVGAAHRGGKEVWGWTVDHPEEVAHLRAAGVDGAASNNPGWLKRELSPAGSIQGKL